LFSNKFFFFKRPIRFEKIYIALGGQWLATLYTAGIGMLLTFTLGRVLGPKAFGVYSFVLSLASLYFILQEGGFTTLIFREGTAASPELGHHKDRILSIALGHLLLTTLGGFFLSLSLPISDRYSLCVAILCFAGVALSNFISAVLKAQNRFAIEGLWRIFLRTCTALCMFFVLFLGIRNPFFLFGAWGLGLLAAFSLPYARRMWQKPSFHFSLDIYSPSLSFLVIGAATTIYFKVDIILLRYLGIETAWVGYYSAAYRLLEGMVLLVTPVAHLCFRQLRLHRLDGQYFKRMFILMLGGMSILGLLIVITGLYFGSYFIHIAYGQSYTPAIPLFKWLLVAVFFIFPNYILTQSAIAINREGYYALMAVCAAILNVGLNLWLIPQYGAVGAAWATIATECFLGLGLGLFFLRWYRQKMG